MAITITHPFVSAKPDGTDASLIQPSNWNDNHSVIGTVDVANGGTGATTASGARTNLGLGTMATQDANNVAITGGSLAGVTLTSLDASTTFQDNADPTKQMQFQLSSITGGQTSVLTVPDTDGTLVLEGATQTLTNKTLTNPTINAGSGVLVAPQSTTPAQTAEGSVVWDSDNDLLTVGDGASRKTMVDVESAQSVTGTKTFTSSVHTTTDINGGTIDGTSIGATTPSTGAFTNLSASGTFALTGDQVQLAEGGTGASLVDPNADRLMFWDDSAGAVTWLTAGTGLSITDTTISATGGGGGATGGGTDEVFYENDQTVTTNYTITSGKNALTAGPITISTGVTVTVPSGSVWTIV